MKVADVLWLCFLGTILAASNVRSDCECGRKKPAIQSRIVGGDETEVNEYPMMAGLYETGYQFIMCGAVIISDRHALTAAHCANFLKAEDTELIVGEHDVTKESESPDTKRYKITSYTLHPSYNTTTDDFDVAIVNVAEKIKFSDRVGVACLPFKFKDKDFTGEQATVMGWGLTEFGGAKSDVLLKAEVDIISREDCAAREKNITPGKLCTLTPGKDACQFDSGGPLLYTDPETDFIFDLAVVSSGHGCGQGYPGVYIKVPPILDWIVSTTKADFCRK